MLADLNGFELVVWIIVAALWMLSKVLGNARKQKPAHPLHAPPPQPGGNIAPEDDILLQAMRKLKEITEAPAPRPEPAPAPTVQKSPAPVATPMKKREKSEAIPLPQQPAHSAPRLNLLPAMTHFHPGSGLSPLIPAMMNGEGIRAAIVAREILGPPLGLRRPDNPFARF